jgi:DNA polymerase III delta prime subunit
MGNEEHYLWVERYRPDTLEGYIGNEHFIESLTRWLAEGDIPHLLLYGPAGTGKTTAAKILVKNLNCDYLFINASDENSVDTIRNKLRGFAAAIAFQDLKIAVLDEADFVTPQGQAALRNLMETFSKACRFILTANYRERIIDPIQSRCQQFEIEPPSRKEAAIHLASILKKEGVAFKPKDVALLVDAHYPDLRQIINDAQSHTSDGKLRVEARQIAESDYKTHILQVLTSSVSQKEKFQAVRQIIADAKVKDFAPLFRLLFDRVDGICPNSISPAILAIAEGLYKDTMVVDKEINAMATLISVLQVQK